MELRAAGLQDEKFLYELYASTREQELQAWGWDEAARSMFIEMQWRAQRASYLAYYPGAEDFIIWLGEERAGRLYVSRCADRIVLVDIALLPRHCNKGLGSRLLADLQEEAARTRLPVQLSVRMDNRAKHWYERMSFTATEEDGLYVRMEWTMS
ncbi:GNAT family N-acetyltransferase [Cohnella nanjingensis]|uniref:GNAT family N-acetyltransferase n=1 Tax=Cohnella nanjingensis TaxID=1387779 RepID=A0A7X0RSZ9_9BACL|nr:GNAT family N-acetyltransferase [Cohnella nanjingensis]MBB6672966.1 GNAT family N-acetyltransferase [Cohnella nanjingensis]